ncbi:hypothetical protein FH972_019940 [Carpinus fangiana]|uniref:Uncharacterized protein n=1 Tax=Carpinus fangiana TaxID=176857 RepID=A0A5N6RRY6_9ROSI|nr:hypothetical protein FH972_019940 [Carpinus fangiana]
MAEPHSTSARRASLHLFMVQNLTPPIAELHFALAWPSLTLTQRASLRLSMVEPHSASAQRASFRLSMAKSLTPPLHGESLAPP